MAEDEHHRYNEVPEFHHDFTSGVAGVRTLPNLSVDAMLSSSEQSATPAILQMITSRKRDPGTEAELIHCARGVVHVRYPLR